jgi:hypothetical protein
MAGLSPKITSSGGKVPTDSDHTALEAVADMASSRFFEVVRGKNQGLFLCVKVLHLERQVLPLSQTLPQARGKVRLEFNMSIVVYQLGAMVR